MAPSEPNQNPFQGEFFSANLPQRFIRESVQNSLDARAGSDPVTVRFTISGPEGAVGEERARRYLTGLRPHFESVVRAETVNGKTEPERRRELKRRQALLDSPLPFLTVEDFGTTGLQGDIRANDIRADGNDFWGFFRSIGISPKGADAGGSWGLGKWVFPDSSKLNAFLGVTRRVGEERFLLMGQAMLKLHRVEKRKYPPEGCFAAGSNEEDRDWLPMPVESGGARSAGDGADGPGAPGDEARLDHGARFVRGAMRDFGLRPGGEEGTSVVVPHPMDELTDPANLAYAVVRQYFHPIVAGDLVVEIVGPGLFRRTIDAGSIADEARRSENRASDDPEQQPEALVRVIALAEWGRRQRSADLIHADGRRKQPVIPQDRVKELRERYQNGKRLAFLVRSRVHNRENRFHVFLERDDSLAAGHDYYVRGHLHIPQMDSLTRHRARALVVVDNTSDLGHLLRDAEGPSHETWRADAPRLREQGWRGASERVWEVRNAAARILDALVERPRDIQRDALSDLFPAEAGGERGRGGKPGPGQGSGQGSGQETVILDGRPSFRVSRVPGGFELTPADAGDLTGLTFEVMMAYDVARGTTRTAFSRFERGLRAGSPDFSLRNGHLRLETRGCEATVVTENEVAVHVRDPEFQLAVTGFDNRDVVVKVSPLPSETPETDSGEA